jgi:alkane 1-monooxygenase
MKFPKKYGYLLAFLIPLQVVAGYALGGYWNLLTVVSVYGRFPVLDFLIGNDPTNPAPADEAALSDERFFRYVTYAWVGMQVLFLGWAVGAWALGSLAGVPRLGFLLGVATVTGGIGITVAHELGHRTSALERFLGQLALVTVGYRHFYIEHNQGHHVHVGTPRDPATSRKNESFYAFWVRTVAGSWRSAWQIETARLRRIGQPIWSFQNRILAYPALTILFCALLTAGWSLYAGRVLWSIPIFFVLQSIGAFTLLELVNYVEHYGIVRREIAPGRYERVNPLHAWNATPLASNFFLFQLQRHADRPFTKPAGYPALIQLALIPPLWFRWMNPRLEAWQRRQFDTSE